MPKVKPRKKRISNVKKKILRVLAKGPTSGPELVKRIACSPAGLYLNLNSLRKDGLVRSTRNGRRVLLEIVDGLRPAAAQPKTDPKSKRAPATKDLRVTAPSAGSTAMLNQALDFIDARLARIELAEQKLNVLRKLKETVPHPVATVLQGLITDLERLTGR